MNRFRPLMYAATGVAGFALIAGQASASEQPLILKPVDDALSVQFDVAMNVRDRAGLEALEKAQQEPGPQRHQWITPQDFAARFGLTPTQLDQIKRELRASGLAVSETHALSLHVTGNARAVGRAFGTTLATARLSNGNNRLVAAQPLVMPPTLAAVGAVIPAFSPTTHMRKHLQVAAAPDNGTSAVGPYLASDLKQAYKFPSNKIVTGKGVKIGILTDGGLSPADNDAYFARVGLATPKITEINLFDAPPFDPSNPDNSAEVQLDIQQSGGIAPDAEIIHYNIPDLGDDTLIGALTEIVEDNLVDIVSMSFGGPEVGYTPAYNGGEDFTGILRVYDDLFAQGNVQGITFIASSGDFGSKPVPAAACFNPGATASCGGFVASAESPASSPHVTGVGGTNLVTTFKPGSLESDYVSENADADPVVGDPEFGTPATGTVFGSGSGTSIIYPKPDFQKLVSTGANMRAVPDVSLHMGGCPGIAVLPCGPNRSSDSVAVGGTFLKIIGTSASAPDFAGLTALKIQWLGGERLGNENTELYELAALQSLGGLQVYRQDIPGSNGLFSTKKKGYNEVLGLGTIIGTAFLLDPLIAAAGNPQTPSNP